MHLLSQSSVETDQAENEPGYSTKICVHVVPGFQLTWVTEHLAEGTDTRSVSDPVMRGRPCGCW
jgi:hypothetical protein